MTDGSLLRHLARGTEAGDEEFQLKKKILKEAAVEKHLGFRDSGSSALLWCSKWNQ